MEIGVIYLLYEIEKGVDARRKHDIISNGTHDGILQRNKKNAVQEACIEPIIDLDDSSEGEILMTPI